MLAVAVLAAYSFSGSSLSQFFKVLAVEAAVLAGIFILAVYYINKPRTKSRKVPKRTVSRISSAREEYVPEPVDRDYEVPERKTGGKFNWVVDKEKKESEARNIQPGEVKTAKEEKAAPGKKNVSLEIQRWSKAVEFSGSVYDKLKDQTTQAMKENMNPSAGSGMEASAAGEEEPGVREDGVPGFTEEEHVDTYGEEAYASYDFDGEEEGMEPLAEAGPANFSEAGIFEDTRDVKEENMDAAPKCKVILMRGGKAKHKVSGGKTVPVGGSQQFQPELKSAAANKRTSYDTYPSVDLLRRREEEKGGFFAGEDPVKKGDKLIDTLSSFGVGAKILNITRGPAVTRYEIQPDYGVKVSKIVNLTDDIALNLAATGVRIEAPIPGKAAIGIEIPNREVTPVLVRDVIESDEFANHPSKLAFAVGKDIAGKPVVADIAKMPHLLIAGATGAGKSVCINTLIASILYKASPEEVKLLMVDPKVVELSIYNGIPHLLIPVVTDPKKAAGALNWAVQEMANRYRLFAENNVRDLRGYNHLMKERQEGDSLPQVVIIIDELADLMMVAPNDVEDCICRLAQMARAAGMHLVIATQRPSVDVITGVIKANIPSRISFAVSSQIDSRTILDMAGAEKLLGRGDMLFNPLGIPKPVRIQGALITDREVEGLVAFIKSQGPAEYDQDVMEKIESQAEASQGEEGDDDELLPEVIGMVIEQGQASTSLLQRKFKLGYSRAARIIDQMEARGIVGPFEGSKPRRVLITKQQWQEMN